MHIIWTMANNSTVPYFTWFVDQLLEAKQHKITLVILYPKKPEIVDEMTVKGISCHWIPFNDQHRVSGYIKVIPKLYKLLKQLKPDVLHSHLFDDALPALIAARMARIKVRAITKADAGFHWNFKRKGILFDKLNNFNANLIVALTEENKEFIINKEKAKARKTVVIHHGIPDIYKQVNSTFKKQLIEKYGLQEKLVIGVISRLISWKGVKHLLEVAPIIINRYPQCKIFICGDGPQRKELEDYITEQHLNQHVILAGRIDARLIPSLYSIMDIFVHLAKLEPFGLVISEAMMCGTGVIATDTGAARDAIINKTNGYLINNENYKDIINGIEYIIGNKVTISKNARDSALKLFSVNKMYGNHINTYNKFLIQYSR